MSTLKRWLKKLFREWWDIYPKEPLVYVCMHNGVIGAVRAEDYDDHIRLIRKFYRRKSWRPMFAYRNEVTPVFLFSDMSCTKARNSWVGRIEELNDILDGCRVEEMTFELLLYHFID